MMLCSSRLLWCSKICAMSLFVFMACSSNDTTGVSGGGASGGGATGSGAGSPAGTSGTTTTSGGAAGSGNATATGVGTSTGGTTRTGATGIGGAAGGAAAGSSGMTASTEGVTASGGATTAATGGVAASGSGGTTETGTGGKTASGGTTAAGITGGTGMKASTGGSGGTSTGGETSAGGLSAVLDELYEAEAIPPNQLTGFAQVEACAPSCAKPLKPGVDCCSGGSKVSWIVSENGAHPAGWMQFNDISAPAQASYDVTFWYHCGSGDTYGDNNCGGQAPTETGQVGCRPHAFTINGTVMPGAYHFPCFSGSWSTLRVATVSLPLAAGMNTIKVAAPPPRDAVDVDAIEILATGKGHAPRIAVNTTDLLGGN